MDTPRKNPYFVTALAGMFVLISAGALWLYFTSTSERPAATAPSTRTEFTQPSGIIRPESLTIGKRITLEKHLQELVAHEKQQGNITEMGIYFRDLNNGPIVRVNDEVKFSPASLLKLPLAIWYYKSATSSSDLRTQEIQYTGPNGTSIEHFPGNRSMHPGQTYSFTELIELMVEESDNDATAVLAEYASSRNTNSVYRDLGVEPVSNYGTYLIDVRNYSAFFRILYTASYLNKESSNQLLEMLSKSSFSRGIVAGVPSGIPVAHKFGERTITSGSNQLHDCGIVYVPEKPYILCVMTQGPDYDELAKVISEVSREAYVAVTSSEYQ